MSKKKPGQAFAPWQVEAGRVITNGRVRFYLNGFRDPATGYTYEPCWLDRLAYTVCDALNKAKDTGEYRP